MQYAMSDHADLDSTNFTALTILVTDLGGRGIYGVISPRLLGCWDRGFKSRSGHGCLSLVLYVVLSCAGRGLCDGLITHPEESYRVFNCV
jgi:hypothetical protein